VGATFLNKVIFQPPISQASHQQTLIMLQVFFKLIFQTNTPHNGYLNRDRATNPLSCMAQSNPLMISSWTRLLSC